MGVGADMRRLAGSGWMYETVHAVNVAGVSFAICCAVDSARGLAVSDAPS